jgi:transcriptional regulator with XRE-family HTH domain
MEKLKHWTSRSIADFVYRIASDFVAQLEMKLEREGTTQKELADRLKLSVGRVSQVLNDPGNLTIKNTVRFAQALGMKVALIAYEDGDPANARGPISSEVFTMTWMQAGRPRDLFQLSASTAPLYQVGGARTLYGDFVFTSLRATNGIEVTPPPAVDYGVLAGQLVH